MNHNYNTPQRGTEDWHIPINENFELLDRDVEVRDLRSNLDQYDPTDGSKFLAKDTGEVFIGAGSTWEKLGSLSGSESSVDTLVTKDTEGTTRIVDQSGVVDRGSNEASVLQRAFEDNNRDVFIAKPRDGTDYLIDSELVLKGSGRIVRAERGTTIRAQRGAGLKSLLQLDESSLSKNLVIEGLHLQGNNSATYALDVPAVQHSVIRDVSTNFTGCGIRIRDVPDVHGSFWNSIINPHVRVATNAPTPSGTGRKAGILVEYTGGNQPNQNSVYGGFVGAGGEGGAALHLFGKVFGFSIFGTEFASNSGDDNQVGVLTEQRESGHFTQHLHMYGGRIEMPDWASGTVGFKNINRGDGEAGKFLLFPTDISMVDTKYDFSSKVYHYTIWDTETPELVMNTNVRLSEAPYATTWINGTKQ